MKENTGAGAPTNAPNVHGGTYTVSHEKHGHFTLKLYTVLKGNLAGKRILALMVGSDNENDFRGVAFWDDDAQRVNTWKRFRSAARSFPIDGYNFGEDWNTVEKKLAIWSNLVIVGSTEHDDGYWYGHGYRLLLEGRCCRCNKKLTTPESIEAGIGPICAGKTA